MMLRGLLFLAFVVAVALVVLVVLRAGSGRRDLPEQRHRRAVRDARARLRSARRGYDRDVRAARRALEKAEKDIDLAQAGGVRLGACSILIRGASHQLSPSTRFRVDVEGGIHQVTVRDGNTVRTRADDQREVYLTITDDSWGDVVKLSPRHLEDARRLAVAGAAAVRNLDTARSEHRARVAAARDDLQRTEADTVAVDEARMTLEDLEGVAGTGPVIDVPRPPDPDGQDPETPETPEDPDEAR